ncbi:aldo/keto reductase [Bradyrhizobium sp. Tv2a-2]|uniref:aldo/keto reductase n=1 Tax=Bradyrhizobium sp. Tv2a-2 TaxID=113395 RepID=UPI00040D7D83|nr:aldo/keto reductase [Bradyrhizobium sp. Tv2a-2]
MKYRQIRGVTVSEIGFGCSGFWGNERFSEAKAISLVHEAFALGINHFDTGHNYCNYRAEPRLGKALANLIADHGRSSLFISTKAGTVRGGLFDRRGTNYSADYIERACGKAVKNLGTGFVDIFYLHGITPAFITDELIGRLGAMRRQGMFRLLGINTHSEDVMHHIAGLPGLFDVALIDFNVAQLDRIPIIQELHRAGIAVMVGNVLAQGHLIPGKIGRLQSMADAYYLLRAALKPASRRLAAKSERLRRSLSSVTGMSAAQAAMAYALSVPQISSCIFGTTNVANLREIAAASSKQLAAKDSASIESAYQGRFALAGV